MSLKTCSKCHHVLSISDFGNCKRSKDKLDHYCKDCRSKADRKAHFKYYRSAKYKIVNHNNKLKRRNIIHDFTPEEWNKKLEDTKGVCPICEKYVGVENLNLDHIIPTSKVPIGTVYKINDVQPLCQTCNSSKSNRIKEKNTKLDIKSDLLYNKFEPKFRKNYYVRARILLDNPDLYLKFTQSISTLNESEVDYLASL